MKKLPIACTVACALLALTGCSGETEKSVTQSQSDSASTSDLAPMSTETSMSDPESTPTTPDTETDTPNTTDQESADWLGVDEVIVEPVETLQYGDFYTYDDGLSISFGPVIASYDPDADDADGPNRDILRRWNTSIAVRNDGTETIDLALRPIAYRGIQEGHTVFSNTTAPEESLTIAPGETVDGIIVPGGYLRLSDGPVKIAAAFESNNPIAILFVD